MIDVRYMGTQPLEYRVIQTTHPDTLAEQLTAASAQGYQLVVAHSLLSPGAVVTIAIVARPLPRSEPEQPQEARAEGHKYPTTYVDHSASPEPSQGLVLDSDTEGWLMDLVHLYGHANMAGLIHSLAHEAHVRAGLSPRGG